MSLTEFFKRVKDEGNEQYPGYKTYLIGRTIIDEGSFFNCLFGTYIQRKS